jgi:hypothetical protein
MNHATECTNVNEQGEDCHRPLDVGSPVSLCRIHLVLAAQYIVDMQRARKEAARKTPVGRPKLGRPQVVYYLRLGNRIKIGTSTNLPTRLLALPHDEVLAVEPGGNAVEHNRHLQFAKHRKTGEWFASSPELREHIASVRRTHGEPMRVWEQVKANTPG